MFNVVYRRPPTQHLGRPSESVVHDAHHCAFFLEQRIGIAADSKWVIDVLQGLETRYQAELSPLKILKAELPMADQRTNGIFRPGYGGSGRLHADYFCEAVSLQFLKKRPIAGA